MQEKKGMSGGILGWIWTTGPPRSASGFRERRRRRPYRRETERKTGFLPSSAAGTERDVWTYGKEALETARRGGVVLADRLLSRALAGEQLEIGGEWFEAAALLALFIKRSLSLLGGAMRPEKADFFMFTLERVDRQALEMVERIALPALSSAGTGILSEQGGELFFL